MRNPIVLLCLLVLSSHAEAGSSIYRCLGSAGEVTFSQTACGDAPVRHEAPAAQSIGEGLRESEKAWLKSRNRKPKRVRQKKVSADRDSAQHDRQAYRCHRARQQLDAVEAERRRGYRAGKGTRLRERAQRYRTYLDSFCS